MPAYPWLYDRPLDTSHIEGKIITLRRLGVPYPDGLRAPGGRPTCRAQAARIADGLTARRPRDDAPISEIVALIAYLQRLGTDIKAHAGR